LHQVSNAVEHLFENVEDFYREKVCWHLWCHNKVAATDRKAGLLVTLVQEEKKS
jgi:hypothetical protein